MNNSLLIDNAYFGSTPAKYLYYGSELVWPLTPPAPPGPDILLNWISNGSKRANPNVYFDTGYAPTVYTQAECRYSYASTAGNEVALFGTTAPEKNNIFTKEFSFMLRGYFYNYYGQTSPRTVFRLGRTGYNSTQITTIYEPGLSLGTPSTNTVHTFRTNTLVTADFTGYTVNYDSSVRYAYASDADNSGLGNPSIYLFACNNNGNGPTKFANANTRIYYFKLFDHAPANCVMYRYLIPVLHYNQVKRKYVPCFYDKVSNTYFYNKGTDPLEYEVNGDYLLDYIERDNSGYLQYMTASKVAYNVNVNMGFTVGTSTVQMTDLSRNLVAGAQTNSSNRYGMYFPWYDSSTYFSPLFLGNNTIPTKYSYEQHVGHNHHADNVEWYLSGSESTTVSGSMKWIEFEDGTLPHATNVLRHNVSQDFGQVGRDSNVLGQYIGLFGNANMHAQISTRIYFFDTSKHGSINPQTEVTLYYHNPQQSYVPVIHEGQTCFYDVNNGTYIYNEGIGNPAYVALE